MDFVKAWVLRIVIAAISGIVVLVLNPKGSAEKSVRTAVSLFILCSFVSPFISEIEIPDFETGAVVSTAFDEEKGDTIILEQMRSEISSKLTDVLLKEGVSPESINVDIKLNEDDVVVVEGAVIVIDSNDSDYSQKLKNTVYSELGLNVEIEVNDAKQAE